jgi:peroxiredoxin
VNFNIGNLKIIGLLFLIVTFFINGCSPVAAPQEQTGINQTASEEENRQSEYLELPSQDSSSLAAVPSSVSGSGLQVEPMQNNTPPSGEPVSPPQLDQKAAPVEESASPTVEEQISEPEQVAPNVSGEPTVGFQAPDFSLNTIDGQPFSIAGLRGKNVLINYWVTWCIPCIEEIPVLEKLHKEYQDKNFVVLSINGIAQDDLATVSDTIAQFTLTYPVLLDENDFIYNEYWVRFMPTSFFIDEAGLIRFIQLGSSDEAGLRARIEQLLSNEL